MNHSELKCGLTKRLICASTITLGQRFNWAMHPYEQRWQTDKLLTTPLKPEFFYQDVIDDNVASRSGERSNGVVHPGSKAMAPPTSPEVLSQGLSCQSLRCR
jgi:hypothetical protein